MYNIVCTAEAEAAAAVLRDGDGCRGSDDIIAVLMRVQRTVGAKQSQEHYAYYEQDYVMEL